MNKLLTKEKQTINEKYYTLDDICARLRFLRRNGVTNNFKKSTADFDYDVKSILDAFDRVLQEKNNKDITITITIQRRNKQ